MAPKVSVIIPACNSARTLASTLASVRNQTLHDFEVLVIDDGSLDATPEIVRGVARADARFRVITQANLGVAAARNVGVRASSAPLVATLDGDDLWHPRFLERLTRVLEQSPDDTLMAYAGSRIIDLEDRVLRSPPVPTQEGWVLNQLLIHNFIGNGSAIMFRRTAFEAVGGYDTELLGSEDWLFQLECAARGKFALVPEYLVGYRLVPGALSSHRLRMRRSRVQALRKLFDGEPVVSRPPVRWAFGLAYCKCFLHELRRGHWSQAWHDVRSALHYDPMGTCYLLLGAERLHWLRARVPGRPPQEPGPSFAQLDPRDGLWTLSIRRVEDAELWDAARDLRTRWPRPSPDSTQE